MILIFETGNTSTGVMVRDGNTIKFVCRILDSHITSYKEFNSILNNLFKLNGISVKDMDVVLVSSVVESIKQIEKEYCRYNKLKMFDVDDKKNKLNFKAKKDLGSDLKANIFNCIDLYKENFIIIDMGTTTTFSVVSKGGNFEGVSFMSGFDTCINSIVTKCDKIPHVDFVKPKRVIGQTTEEAVRSGVYYGYIGILKEIVNSIKNELKNQDLKVIMTGGYSNIFIDKLNFITKVIPDLTVNGIYKIYKFNVEK